MKKRINKLALRDFTYTNGMFEIVKYQPNPYYGKQDDYQISDDPDFYKITSNSKIHKNCFLNKEFCTTLCFIEKGVADLRFCDEIQLDGEQECKDFIFLLRSGINKSLRWKDLREKPVTTA